MKHELTDEECCVSHLYIPGEPRGQCRRCRNCPDWIRPKDFDSECPGYPPGQKPWRDMTAEEKKEALKQVETIELK